MLFYLFLLRATRFIAGMNRWQDDNFGSNTVVNHGRMHAHTVLMFLKNMDLPECIDFCMRHLSCVTVSYSASLRECELNDMNFNDKDGDPCISGWINYSRPPIVHGGFSEWKQGTECSRTCGQGTKTYYRFCDNPRPQFGGEECKGSYEKTKPCNLEPCPEDNVALQMPSLQSTTEPKNINVQYAKFGNDGDFKTRSRTKQENNPYWEVDLMQPIVIRLIRLHLLNYYFVRQRYKNLEVYTRLSTSDDWSLCKKIGTPVSLKIDVSCYEATRAQYVRIKEIHNQALLSLVEVEVYKW